MISADMSRIERTLLIVALLFIIVIAVKMTALIVSLLMMACVITLLALPAMNWLKSRGCSDLLSVLIVTLAGCLIVIAVISLTALSFHALLADLPQYQDELNMRLADITTLLASVGLEGMMSMLPTFNISNIMMAGISGVMGLADGLMFLFFVGVTSFFMLLEAPDNATFRTEVRQRFGDRKETFPHDRVCHRLYCRANRDQFHTRVPVRQFPWDNGRAWRNIMGSPDIPPRLYPVFGLIMAAIPAIFFAWLQFGVPGAVAVIVAVCILNLLVENPVFSYLTARKFEIPALVVILSVIIWGWLLGLVGMLFAVPFTLMILLIIEISDELRWINVTLGVSRLFEEKDITGEPEDQR